MSNAVIIMCMQIHIVQNGDLVKQGMEFRSRIMQQAFGLDPALDPDSWDTVAWHVVAEQHGEVIGYYRAMQCDPLGFCTEVEFDLAPLAIARDQILEIGRAAADPRYPTAILRLWQAVISLAQRLDKKWIMGTASLKVRDFDTHYLSEQWRQRYRYRDGSHAVPRIPYQGNGPGTQRDAPALIQTYERIGAHIVSDLGWDPRFQTADVVTLLDIDCIEPAWRKKLRLDQ